MQINANYAQRAVACPHDRSWVASPSRGVSRVMLDRDGGEVARATSLVRFDPGSTFSRHVHDGGEEFLVLEGVFEDEHGRYGPGAYVRNPPGSSHSPGSASGCIIFVKLRHFAREDTQAVCLDTTVQDWRAGVRPGLEVIPLHEHKAESTALVRWSPGAEVPPHLHPGGAEFLVLDGAFSDEYGDYPAGAWIRYPAWSGHAPRSPRGCRLFVKVGHLGPGVASGAAQTPQGCWRPPS